MVPCNPSLWAQEKSRGMSVQRRAERALAERALSVRHQSVHVQRACTACMRAGKLQAKDVGYQPVTTVTS
jgi:hypothetical protein